MLGEAGDTGVLASSGQEVAVAGAREGDEAGVIGSNSAEEEKGNNCGGNRWPRQETLALLKIRSDMDAVFRDSSLKGPLWEHVSRKLGELGYSRSAKKCKEKFENVYKYHKRTKEGRTGKAEGKTYRFFDQLQALDNQPKPQITVPLTTSNPTIMFQNVVSTPITSSPIIPPIPAKNPAIPSAQTNNPRNILWRSATSASLFSSTSTSSSTASDREIKEPCKRSSKRKWKEFFQRLAREVIEKQEKLQEKFLETIEKHENERTVKEDAWRMQEMARINREHEILVQERSTAAAKDAAVLSLLQKISGQTHVHDNNNNNNITTLSILPNSRPPPPPPPMSPASSSRWPKAEVQALINLRTVLALKYQESGPKGPLWEEISAGMRRHGYSRSSKRCKEKWENINKYFKKVKNSNTKRPEDSKTCPYFHQLDSLYKEKNKIGSVKPNNLIMEPLMVQPEQQWPLQEITVMEDIIHHKENVEQNGQEDDNDADSTEEEDDGGGYEMVLNKPSSMENIAK
ncbi:trihelix transcription factor DF1-like isoform X2 [Alnus glutinosa]|nr:trihelix transcription factor DF1-like isoform X2 [Alnus glutinosa]